MTSDVTTFTRLLTGSFAYPAAENPTVEIVEAAYRHHGLRAIYVNCEVPPSRLADAVRGAWAMGWAGFNCSLPHKVSMVSLIDEVAPSAQAIGAVNCVVRREDRLVGENTDGKGFLRSLRTVTDPAGLRVAVLGAGGAARAIAVELAMAGAARIDIVNRDPNRGADLARTVSAVADVEVGTQLAGGTYRVPADTQLLVNATSIGLYPNIEQIPDIDLESLRPGLIVADVIPNPPLTKLLSAAQSAGSTVLDGLGMLVNQAAIGIGLWTGLDVDTGVMRRRLIEIFGARRAPQVPQDSTDESGKA